jgi:RNA polymerase sigma factor (sigma-70 family)
MQTTLDKLAEHDNRWRAYAYSITNNTQLGDELVQEMYIKFDRNGYTKTNSSYVYWCILNLFRDVLRTDKHEIDIEDVSNYLTQENEDNEATAAELMLTEKLKQHDPYYADLALMEVDGKTFRELGKRYRKHYSTISYNVVKIKDSLKFDKQLRDSYLAQKQ